VAGLDDYSAKTIGLRRSPSRLSRRTKTLTRKATGAKRAQSKAATPSSAEPTLLSRILTSLDADKAEDIVTVDLAGRSSIADALVIASGRSARHVSAIAEHLARKLKEAGYGTRPVDGLSQGDWVLVDAGDAVVHIFRPEVRAYYDLEGMWSVGEPTRVAAG
jgi:ribosome-associated protein